MALNSKEKSELIEKFQKSNNDTGSSEIQIALLTKRIDYLTRHFETHKKDQQ